MLQEKAGRCSDIDLPRGKLLRGSYQCCTETRNPRIVLS